MGAAPAEDGRLTVFKCLPNEQSSWFMYRTVVEHKTNGGRPVFMVYIYIYVCIYVLKKTLNSACCPCQKKSFSEIRFVLTRVQLKLVLNFEIRADGGHRGYNLEILLHLVCGEYFQVYTLTDKFLFYNINVT